MLQILTFTSPLVHFISISPIHFLILISNSPLLFFVITNFTNNSCFALLKNPSTTMKKVVLKVDLHDDRIKQKAMKAVSGISGVESVSVDMKDKKLTLMGDIDPVHVVSKLRKLCHTEIVSVGAAKEEKKKEEPKKMDDKKDSAKIPEPVKLYEAYPLYYQMRPTQYNQYHYVTGVEEDPQGCVIC